MEPTFEKLTQSPDETPMKEANGETWLWTFVAEPTACIEEDEAGKDAGYGFDFCRLRSQNCRCVGGWPASAGLAEVG